MIGSEIITVCRRAVDAVLRFRDAPHSVFRGRIEPSEQTLRRRSQFRINEYHANRVEYVNARAMISSIEVSVDTHARHNVYERR